jgi:hypothetical protein
MTVQAEAVIKSDMSGNMPPVIFGILLWVPSLYFAIVNPRMWQEFLVVSALVSLILYWLTSFRVSFFPRTLGYKSPFGRLQEIEYTHVRRIHYKIALHDEGRTYSALFMLIIETTDNKLLVVNIKPFSIQALHHIATNLMQKCRNADIDEAVKKWVSNDYGNLSLTWSQRGQLLFRLFLMVSAIGLIQGLIRIYH